MRLYFLRHAEASYNAATDPDRPLTQRGIDRMRVAAEVMQKLDVNPVHIYSSPRVRAVQTAQIVAEALGKTVEVRDSVNFSFNVSAVRALLEGLTERQDVMFVGHNPSMSAVVSQLTGANVSLKKGGLARVDVFTPSLEGCELVWLITPKVFDILEA